MLDETDDVVNSGGGVAFYSMWQGDFGPEETWTWVVWWDRFVGVWSESVDRAGWSEWEKTSSVEGARELGSEWTRKIGSSEYFDYEGDFSLTEDELGTPPKGILARVFARSWEEGITGALRCGGEDPRIWMLFAGLEAGSVHPAARAISRLLETELVASQPRDGLVVAAVSERAGDWRAEGQGSWIWQPAWPIGDVRGKASVDRADMLLDMIVTQGKLGPSASGGRAGWESYCNDLLLVEAGLLAGDSS